MRAVYYNAAYLLTSEQNKTNGVLSAIAGNERRAQMHMKWFIGSVAQYDDK